MSQRLLLSVSFLLLFLMGCSGGKPIEQTQPMELRVMSYNIHHASPPSTKDSIDIAAIVNAISSQAPDLVALQEVDVNTRRSGTGNQAEMIAEKLGMYAYFGKAIDFNGGEYGTAILSRFPISDPITYLLPKIEGPGSESRVLATAKVQLPSGQSILFGSTHLDHRGDPASRLLQVTEILKIAEKEQLPMIVAGDLNAKPDSKEMKLLGTKFSLSCTDCPNTFPADEPDRSIDHIAFYPKGKMEVRAHRVVEEALASDHRPVFTLLRISE